MKHFFTPGGWHEYVKGFCWLIGSWLVYKVVARLGLVSCWISSLCTLLCPRKWSLFLTSQPRIWKHLPFPQFWLLSILSWFHRENTSSIYLFQNSDSVTLGAQRLFMCGFRFGKVFIVTHAKSFFSCGFASSDFYLRPKICWPTPTPKYPAARGKNPSVTGVRFKYNSVSMFGFLFRPWRS